MAIETGILSPVSIMFLFPIVVLYPVCYFRLYTANAWFRIFLFTTSLSVCVLLWQRVDVQVAEKALVLEKSCLFLLRLPDYRFFRYCS